MLYTYKLYTLGWIFWKPDFELYWRFQILLKFLDSALHFSIRFFCLKEIWYSILKNCMHLPNHSFVLFIFKGLDWWCQSNLTNPSLFLCCNKITMRPNKKNPQFEMLTVLKVRSRLMVCQSKLNGRYLRYTLLGS